MTQLSLLPAPETIGSPWCIYERCTRKGRAVVGPEEVSEECVNVRVTCQCGVWGWQSTNTIHAGRPGA